MALITTAARSEILALVVGMFGAAPGNNYLNQIVSAVEAGATISGVANTLAKLPLFNSTYPSSLTAQEFADKLVANLLGEVTDTAAKTWANTWVVGRLNAGVTRGDVILTAVQALTVTTNTAYANAKLALANKVAVSEYYSVTKQLSDTDLADLQGVITGVTSSAATVTTAKATIDGINSGLTLTLTTGSDTSNGSGGNDVFNGFVDQATPANSTLSAADVINGGAGNDILNVTGLGTTVDILNAALVTGVETVNIRATTANSLDASQIGGLTAVNANLGTGTVLVTKLATGASIGIIGNGTVAQGEVAFAYATVTTAVTLNIANGVNQAAGDSVTAAATIAAGDATGTATKATINSTGAANVLDVVDLANATLTSVTFNAATNLKGAFLSEATNQVAATGTVTVTGAATTVEFTAALDNDIKSIDASAMTAGGVKATLGTGTEDYKGGAGVDTITLNTGIKTATFGAGNDVVTASVVNTTTAGAVSGGDGTDTLVVATATDVDTAGERAVFTSFETLSNKTAAAIAADGFAGVTAVISAAAGGGFSGLSAAQAAAVTNTVDQAAVTYALATATGTSDVLSIVAKHATATSSADLAGLTVTGFEILNVTSSSGNVDETHANANVISFAAAADLSTITVAGAFAANLILDNTAKAVTVTSTQTGTAALRVEGEVTKGSSITTTANGDTIETALAGVAGAAGEFVTYNAGTGDDAISTSLTGLNNTNNGFASLKIEGGLGTDTLTFQAADVTFVDANFQYVTGVEKLVVASTTALNLTSGGFFDNNFKATGIDLTATGITNGNTATINLGSFTGTTKLAFATTADGATVADNVSVTTGSGADDVTVTAASWVGAAGAAGSLTVTTGAGNDKITVTTGTLLAVTGTNAVTVNSGLGADTITAVHVNAVSDLGNFTFVVADGDSLAASRDMITGFDLGTGALFSDTLDLQGTPTVAAATAGLNGTDSGTLKSHAIVAGVITFDDVDTYATAVVINEAGLSDALAYLAANITTAGDTVAFGYDSDSNGTADATIVFQQGAADTVIQLVGVVGLSISATNATTLGLIDLA